MRISPFDAVTAAPDEAAAYAALVASSRADATPDGLRQPEAYVLNRLRHRGTDDVTHVLTAGDAGAVEVSWREAPDNRDRAFVTVDVPRERHSDDVVHALLRAAAEVAGASGRTILQVDAPVDSPLDGWLRGLGLVPGSVEQHNVTRVRSLDRADIAALAGDVPDGYELVTFDRSCPDDLLEACARLANTMNTAPRDDLTMEDWTFSPDTIRRWEDTLIRRGQTRWTAIARSVSTGELAGYNEVVVRPDFPAAVENEDTAVAIPHRGHGLGLWVKAINVLRVIDETDAVCIETWNAASNDHMLRVNRRLGFVCEHLWHSYELPAAKVLS